MAKTNMPATGAISAMPCTMKVAVDAPKPPISAAATGIRIRAAIGDMRLSRIAARSATMVKLPRSTSIAAPSATDKIGSVIAVAAAFVSRQPGPGAQRPRHQDTAVGRAGFEFDGNDL